VIPKISTVASSLKVILGNVNCKAFYGCDVAVEMMKRKKRRVMTRRKKGRVITRRKKGRVMMKRKKGKVTM
jgi:hypothetical protein